MIIIQIYYGIFSKCIDVTDICLDKLKNNNLITIPSVDHDRANYFQDPLPGIKKKIFIRRNNVTTEYDDTLVIYIDVENGEINTTVDIDQKVRTYHQELKLNHGSFEEELPEQKMAVRYLTGDEKVLEIGGNIGRNSLIIAKILSEKNNNNFVTLESNEGIYIQLCENRDLNHMKFHIENSALSKRKLIQRWWDTIPCDFLLEGYQPVNTITLEDLYSKYNIDFDTLVLDCEGAFYYILMDMPEILDNIKLIIMENDYLDITKKQYIDEEFKKRGFYVDYVESGGWGPCYDFFFQVWKK